MFQLFQHTKMKSDFSRNKKNGLKLDYQSKRACLTIDLNEFWGYLLDKFSFCT